MTEMKENCRKQTGNLKINNKLYPIYEGLNIIGRDLKATVILKETIFSKLHAAISVVDSNIHLICDLNSSNGTQLGKSKLIPYKFYSIKDHEPIIFGDVVGMYFIGAETQNNCVVKVTQNVDHEAETQILNNLNNTVENIHDLPTQQFDVDIHEAPTQMFDGTNNINESLTTQKLSERNNLNIHEAPTQNFSNTEHKIENLNLHEAPTQNFSDANNKIENLDLHKAPTQICLKTNNEIENKQNDESNYNIDDNSDDDATQELVVNTEKAPVNKNDEDATQDLEFPQNQNDEDATQDLELSRTDVYDDIFANESFRSSLEKSVTDVEVVEVDETVLVQSQKNAEEFKSPENLELMTNNNENNGMSDDDDIILSTQVSEAIDQKYREHQEEINSTKEKLSEDVSDSDATDVEDEQLLMAGMANIPYLEQGQNADVPDNLDIAATENQVIIENNANEHSDEEELDLLASTTSKSDNNTEESKENNESITKEAEVTSAKSLATNEANKSSDDETDDELPATQLLHFNSNKKIQPQIPELDDNNDIYFAATQKISAQIDNNKETVKPSSKCNGNNVNEIEKNIKEGNSIYSAPTQILPPENEGEDEFSAATQKLSLGTENPVVFETSKPKETSKSTIEDEEDDIFSAATQILHLEPETPKNQDENDDIFSAATQKLHFENEITKPVEKTKNNEEDIFSAATQILAPPIEQVTTEKDIFSAATQKLNFANGITKPIENTKKGEGDIFSAETQILDPLSLETNANKTTETIENDIFSAPTQVVIYPENEVSPDDDIFNAPTQILLEEEEVTQKKSSESVLLSSESNDESMRLHLSETEHSMCNLNQEKQQQNTETQLEVDFELETQKLYIEEKTSRPDNPLSHMFAEEATEQFEDNDKNEDLNTSVNKLTPIVSVVDIKKSKITLKDIQEASTSKIKKSYVKLERIRQEPTRRSNRNARESEKQEEPDTAASDNEATEKIVTKEAKTPRRRTTRMATSDTFSSEVTENSSKEEIVVKEGKPSKRRKIKTSTPAEPEIKKTESIKEIDSTPKEKSEETIENVEDNDFIRTPSRPTTRGKRRDYRSIAKGDMGTESATINSKNKITSKSFTSEKIEELEIHVKEERKKRSATKSIDDVDSDDSVFRSKRSKRNNNKEKEEISEKHAINEDSDGSSIEIKIRRKVPRIEETQEEPKPKRITRTARIKQESVDEIKEIKEGRTRRARKATKRNHDDNQEAIIIEDSDESILETHRKLQESKIEENDKPTQLIQTRKRNNLISPERNKTSNSSDICLNTPNSKRRRYEPLSVNISTSQLNNGPEHQVVFTMLNDTSLENIVRKLGGSVVDSIQNCSVLVTNKISRSLKFLIAIALGKPIVHIKWILDSQKKKKFQDPWDYLLEDTESEAKFKMSLKESLTTSREKKLLTGETILLATTKNFQVLKEIIETSGGKCITRALPKSSKTVVVCYEEERSKYSKYLKQKTFVVVSAEAIFSGVLQQKINWKQYILS